MRELSRIKRITEKVERIWHRNPDLRYTQLVSAILSFGANAGIIRARKDYDYFYLEDDEFETVLDYLLKEKHYE